MNFMLCLVEVVNMMLILYRYSSMETSSHYYCRDLFSVHYVSQYHSIDIYIQWYFWKISDSVRTISLDTYRFVEPKIYEHCGRMTIHWDYYHKYNINFRAYSMQLYHCQLHQFDPVSKDHSMHFNEYQAIVIYWW